MSDSSTPSAASQIMSFSDHAEAKGATLTWTRTGPTIVASFANGWTIQAFERTRLGPQGEARFVVWAPGLKCCSFVGFGKQGYMAAVARAMNGGAS